MGKQFDDASYGDLTAYQALMTLIGMDYSEANPADQPKRLTLENLAAIISTGWVSSGLTWTYASAATFTITGDVTAIYRKGTKLQLTQTTVKYFHVASSSYSAPDTIVTIIVNTDYTLANAAITAPYYSHTDNPEGFPGWFTWAPSPTGFSAIPTSTVYRYCIHGRRITLNYYEGADGTSNATTFTATAPVAATGIVSVAMGLAVDNSSTLTVATRAFISTTTIIMRTNMANGTWTGSGGKRAWFVMDYEF